MVEIIMAKTDDKERVLRWAEQRSTCTNMQLDILKK